MRQGEVNQEAVRLSADTYVDMAEQVIAELARQTDQKGRPIPMLTTSKIRNMLSMTADIYNDVKNSKEEVLTKDVLDRLQYLRVRFVYEAGREKTVKSFVNKAKILEYLSQIGNDKEQFILFSRYMEALVAYHRFYGGRDN